MRFEFKREKEKCANCLAYKFYTDSRDTRYTTKCSPRFYLGTGQLRKLGYKM